MSWRLWLPKEVYPEWPENGPTPNHIYRWTEREFKKTIRSCDPTGEHGFQFHYGLNMPYETLTFEVGTLENYF